MDKNTKKLTSKRSFNQSAKLKSQQLIRHKDMSKSSRLASNNDKHIDYLSLNQQFKDFKDSFVLGMNKRQSSLNKFTRFTSSSTCNLLNYESSDNLKRNSKNSIQNNESFEYNLRNILENSSEKSENESSIHSKMDHIINFKDKVTELLNKHTLPIFSHINKLNNKIVVLEQLSSRLKYNYRKNHPKSISVNKINNVESPLFNKIKRRNTQNTISCSQLTSISTSNHNEDKRILQISLKSLLQQQKSSYDTIHKKNKLIDLLVDEIQQLEMKKQIDADLFKAELVGKQRQYQKVFDSIKRQLENADNQNKEKQYLIEELNANLTKANTKYSQLQLELSDVLIIKQQAIKENSNLKQQIQNLQQQQRDKSKYIQNNKALTFQNQTLNHKLSKSIQDIQFYKRYNQQQYKNIQKQFRDFDDGYSKLKAANNILKNKLSQSDKQCLALRKQLEYYRKSTEKNDSFDQYHLLEKNKIDVNMEDLQSKVQILEKLLEESEFKRIQLVESRQIPVKSEQDHQERFRNLKLFVAQLQKQIIEKDRRIWILENNINRIKSNQTQITTLFSPKQTKAYITYDSTKKSANSNSSLDGRLGSGNPKMIESVMINGFSLSKYI